MATDHLTTFFVVLNREPSGDWRQVPSECWKAIHAKFRASDVPRMSTAVDLPAGSLSPELCGRPDDVMVAEIRAILPRFARTRSRQWSSDARIRHLKSYLIEHTHLDVSWESLRASELDSLWREIRAMTVAKKPV